MVKLAAALHDGAEHLIVRAAGEENFARVELEKGASYGPYIDSEVVWHS